METSGCREGWSASPLENKGKCYKLFDSGASFAAADATCRSLGIGSLGSHLVEIESRTELEVVKGLCRGERY